MNACEMCESNDAIRREDNIYLCDTCNNKYPTGE